VGGRPNLYPLVLGHEPSGTVAAVGAGVTGWAPGDRAALEPALYCYHCEFCRSGRHNLCENIRFCSTPGEAPGFFRELINLPVHNLLPIPPGLSLDHATLVEPLAIAVHSLKFAAPRLGETAAVFGAGPIGLLTVAALKAAGAGRVWAVEPLAHRRDAALAVGADAAIDPAGVDPVAQILADTGKRGVEIVIDCAAKQDTTPQSLRAACRGGRVVLTGIHETRDVVIDAAALRVKELSVFGMRRSNHDSHAALELLLAETRRFAPLVTHARPLESIGDAFALNEAYADGVVKTVIRPGERG
jgi:L-iditol 2-dehydrogenase